MKRIKIISLLLSLVLIVCLTGCVGNISEVSINKDGSGTITLQTGMTEEGYELANSFSAGEGGSGETADISKMTSFSYNGNTYYGEETTKNFSSLEEIETILLEEVFSLNEGDIFSISREQDNSISIHIKATSGVDNSESQEIEQMYDPTTMTKEEKETFDQLIATMSVVVKYNLPYPVKQVKGPTEGVIINGNTLTWDFIKMGEVTENKDVEYLFIASPSETPTTGGNTQAKLIFNDVKESSWYYNAVYALANNGIVKGVGNNMFQPEKNLTYAEFCQLLANAKGLETGNENSYWAYKAILSCLNMGYIESQGDIKPENYDIPIPREAAVSAMYLARKTKLNNPNNITETDIPDYDQISKEYKKNILKAYQYRITSGMDSNKTFAPKKSLSRAEICQLFYNLNWTSVEY